MNRRKKPFGEGHSQGRRLLGYFNRGRQSHSIPFACAPRAQADGRGLRGSHLGHGLFAFRAGERRLRVGDDHRSEKKSFGGGDQ